jgi:hypothetical protein
MVIAPPLIGKRRVPRMFGQFDNLVDDDVPFGAQLVDDATVLRDHHGKDFGKRDRAIEIGLKESE